MVIIGIALWFLHRELAGLSYKAVVGHIKSISTLTLLASVARHNGRPVFYEVANESLNLYVDLGLTLSKIGENARVSLEGFS